MKALRSIRAILGLVLLVLLANGCESDSTGPEPSDPREMFALEALPSITHPPDNPAIPDRIALGRMLFFDPILSGHGDVACATCHHPNFAWADGRQLSVGVSGVGLGPERALSNTAFNLEPRNSPTVLNTAFNGMVSAHDPYDPADAPMFWDGRVNSLETQSTKPITSRVEMRGDAYPGTDAEATEVAFDSVLARLRQIPLYEQLFRGAFIPEGDSVRMGLLTTAINKSTYARAIGCFERTLVGNSSPFDRYVLGDDNALTASQKRGLELFFTKGNCSPCHKGAMFSDYRFVVQGVQQFGPGKALQAGEDFGRMEHTSEMTDQYAFRTPTLRNAELTAPYMHDGALATLDDVIDFYNRGGGDHPDIPRSMIDPDVKPLGLTDQEKADLVEFLKSLTDESFDVSKPTSVPSGLPMP